MTDVVRRDQVMENKCYKKQFYSQNVKSWKAIKTFIR